MATQRALVLGVCHTEGALRCVMYGHTDGTMVCGVWPHRGSYCSSSASDWNVKIPYQSHDASH